MPRPAQVMANAGWAPADGFRLAINDSGRPRREQNMCFQFFANSSTLATVGNTATSASDGEPDWATCRRLSFGGKELRTTTREQNVLSPRRNSAKICHLHARVVICCTQSDGKLAKLHHVHAIVVVWHRDDKLAPLHHVRARLVLCARVRVRVKQNVVPR